MTRYKLSISYDGSKFYGSQIQRDRPTVAGCLEGALKKAIGVSPRLLFASRTDRGVHARENVCSFKASLKMPESAFLSLLNSKLGGYVRTWRISAVSDCFNPRHGCLSKIYRYYARTGASVPYMRDYRFFVPRGLDRGKMNRAAEFLKGKKDFRRLSSCSGREDTLCDVINCRVSKGLRDFYIEIEGSHFLYKMVRTAASFILACGRREIEPDELGAILSGSGKRVAPAPPGGLYLWRVKY